MLGLFMGEWNLFWECHGILRGRALFTKLRVRCFFILRMEGMWLCQCVGQTPKTATYALCIINESAERGLTMDAGPRTMRQYLSLRVRSCVWLCARLLKTEANKETFESAGGSVYITRKQKKQSVA